MIRPRLTVFLMIHKNALYKSINFSKPVYIGDPMIAVRIYNDFLVDELILIDVDSTVNSLEPKYRLLEDIASVARMPLCYGGGLKEISQIKKIISLGFEKVSLSSTAINKPEIVKEAVDELGSQSIVGCMDIKQDKGSKNYYVYTHRGTKLVDLALFEVVDLFINSGVGEILINNISRDGTYEGYDKKIIRKISEHSPVPVTAVGGAKSITDIKQLFETCGVMGLAAGSLWSFKEPNKAVLLNYPSEQAKERLFNQD